jgi:hypothetical protein
VRLDAWTKRGIRWHWTPCTAIDRYSFAIIADPCACGKRAESLFFGWRQEWLNSPPEGARVCAICAAAAVAHALEGGE